MDEYGQSSGRDGCDGRNGRTSRASCDHGRVSLDLRLLMYFQKVEDHSVHMYIDRHTVTQDRLPNRKKGHMESLVTLHHQSLDEPASSKALLPDKDYMQLNNLDTAVITYSI